MKMKSNPGLVPPRADIPAAKSDWLNRVTSESRHRSRWVVAVWRRLRYFLTSRRFFGSMPLTCRNVDLVERSDDLIGPAWLIWVPAGLALIAGGMFPFAPSGWQRWSLPLTATVSVVVWSALVVAGRIRIRKRSEPVTFWGALLAIVPYFVCVAIGQVMFPEGPRFLPLAFTFTLWPLLLGPTLMLRRRWQRHNTARSTPPTSLTREA